MPELSRGFGEQGGLIGTVCVPAGGVTVVEESDLGVVLFNAGVVHRVGPHRVNVKLARALLGHGVPSIRFDLHGMGDSVRAGGALSHREQVTDDLRRAMDELQRETGVSRFALFGFCSGAMQSLYAAQTDPRVRRIVLYDGFAAPTPKSRWRFFMLRLRARGLGPSSISRVLRRAWKSLCARLSSRGRPDADMAASEPSLPELASAFGELARRGVDVVVLNAGADFSQFNYEEQAHEALVAAGMPPGAARCGFLPGTDHVVTSRAAQHDFIEWLCVNLRGHVGQAPDDAWHDAGGARP